MKKYIGLMLLPLITFLGVSCDEKSLKRSLRRSYIFKTATQL